MCLYSYNKRPIERVDYRLPGGMMLLCYINNNMVFSFAYSSGGYQDEYENWEIYPEINKFLGLEPKQKASELVVRVTRGIINIWKQIYRYIIDSCLGVLFFLFFKW